jgi:glycosyltransferase involved in cell wall biosynthesis
LSRPLRFLQLTTFYPPHNIGGSGMYVYRLAHALGSAGHQVDVIYCHDSYRFVHPGAPESAYPEHPNVRVHGLRSGYGWLSPLLSHQTGRPLLKERLIQEILDRNPPDVIHFHNITLFGPAVLRLKPASGHPIKVYTTHDHWLSCPIMTLWKFNSRLCEKPECIRCSILAKRPPQLWRYTNLIEDCTREVDLFVAPSKFTASMHATRGFPHPVKHLPLVIGPEYQVGPTARPHSKPYFLFVGRLELVKGLQTLIRLWDKVDADLLVAGTGNYGDKLRAMAAANPRIIFLGQRSSQELASLYEHSLASVVPSIYYETGPFTVIEAFARKAPAIAHDMAGMSELIRESGGGILYRTDEELLAALSRIAGSPSLRDQLGEKGYQMYQLRWSQPAHLEMYLGMLREVALRKFGSVPWEAEREHSG